MPKKISAILTEHCLAKGLVLAWKSWKYLTLWTPSHSSLEEYDLSQTAFSSWVRPRKMDVWLLSTVSGASQVTLVIRNPLASARDIEIWVWSLGQDYLLEEGVATHSSILAWSIPWTEETGGLQSMRSQRVRYDWAHGRAKDSQRHPIVVGRRQRGEKFIAFPTFYDWLDLTTVIFGRLLLRRFWEVESHYSVQGETGNPWANHLYSILQTFPLWDKASNSSFYRMKFVGWEDED